MALAVVLPVVSTVMAAFVPAVPSMLPASVTAMPAAFGISVTVPTVTTPLLIATALLFTLAVSFLSSTGAGATAIAPPCGSRSQG
ncbi:MAG: hypothetical protein O7H41_14825 [Planctomycetota bacterium]|nr:hypothetical protein [Planctomycetota bacterium]